MSTPHRLGILLSGRGSNFIAIADSIAAGRIPNAEIAVVISNKADAPGLAAARERGLTALAIEANGRKRAEHDAAIIAALREHRVDLVCLAGYMRLLSPGFIQAFPQRILNIHPSLCPRFPGSTRSTRPSTTASKSQAAPCILSMSSSTMASSSCSAQSPVDDTDDAHALSARILAEEHIAYTEAIARVLSGDYVIEGRRYVRKR